MTSSRLAYLPALDGLRAVAVSLVVAYHLEFGWAQGGFLGVDLFFVISGFLITTLLLREREETGRIGLRGFWVRRFRRLVPPLVVMTAATVAATRLFGLPEQWNSVRWDAASALAYVANWRFVTAGQSYFESLLGPSPLRHTWSLAVEEQWYLVWPLVVAGLCMVAARGGRASRVPLIAIGAAVVGSAALMAVLYDPVDPSRVYFGTDTRAQQLLVGAGLAWLVSRAPIVLDATRTAIGRALTWGALAVFVALAATTSDEASWMYHGGFLVASIVAAVLVAATAVAGRDGALEWLSWAPLVWIGTRSYGIYLWHWPVIVFVGPPMGVDIGRLPLAALQVAVTLALAELSFRAVERPIRTATWRPTIVISGWTAASVATVVVATLVLVAPAGRTLDARTVITPSTSTVPSGAPTPPPRTDPATDPPGADESASASAAVAADDDAPATTTAPRTAAAAVRPPTALVLGDSTALKVVDSMDRTIERPWNIEGYVTIGCAITAGRPLDVGTPYGTMQEDHCKEWRTEWASWRQYVRPEVSVVMIGAWEVLDHLVDDVPHRFPGADWYEVVRPALSDALDVAGEDGTPVRVMALPCMRQSDDADSPAQARNDPARIAAFNALLAEVAATKPDAEILDLPSVLCPDGVYLEEIDGEPVRYDGVHVTPAGADLVAGWLIDRLEQEFGGGSATPSLQQSRG